MTLWSIPSAGVRFEVLWIMDHDIRSGPFVWCLSLLEYVHVQDFDQDIWGITGHFLHKTAPHDAIRGGMSTSFTLMMV